SVTARSWITTAERGWILPARLGGFMQLASHGGGETGTLADIPDGRRERVRRNCAPDPAGRPAHRQPRQWRDHRKVPGHVSDVRARMTPVYPYQPLIQMLAMRRVPALATEHAARKGQSAVDQERRRQDQTSPKHGRISLNKQRGDRTQRESQRSRSHIAHE